MDGFCFSQKHQVKDELRPQFYGASMSQPPVLFWFRRDLRLSDNTALNAALESGSPIIPLFIFDEAVYNSRWASPPRLCFMLKALHALDASLREEGSRLLIGQGDPREVLPQLVETSGAVGLYLNRDYTPYARKRDAEVEAALSIPVHAYDDAALLPPGAVLKSDGTPFTVFTPFKKRWLLIPKMAVAAHTKAHPFRQAEGFEYPPVPDLADLGFEPTIAVPEATEAEALRRLDEFLGGRAYDYAEGRNRLAAENSDDTRPSSSFLSPYLRFGLLSPRQAYWGAREAYQQAQDAGGRESLETWVSELVWRDFYMHILYHFPHVLKGSFRPEYDKLDWRHAPEDLQAWKEGRTGYPVVDAAMRQLQAMGWMPNRARMIVASFLTKDLLIDWREGERHFMQWLIDGDPAANNGGWQWSAGTGTDAQPYFRIFNPVAQSEKFDPDGRYIRRWIPELRDVPADYIHAPWEMPRPPARYAHPIIDHIFARERTLAAFKAVREEKPNE